LVPGFRVLAVLAKGLSKAGRRGFNMENFIVELSAEEEMLREVVEPLLVSEGYDLLRLKLKRSQARSILALFVDTAGKRNGVIMDNLTDISRLLSDVLDAKFEDSSVLKGRYDLEVSSPGLDRPLGKISHFKDALSERIKIRKKIAEIGTPKNLSGILLSASDEAITVKPDGALEETMIYFGEIADANIIFDFTELDKNKKKPAKK
jgi:ribosome maturation factor RimP